MSVTVYDNREVLPLEASLRNELSLRLGEPDLWVRWPERWYLHHEGGREGGSCNERGWLPSELGLLSHGQGGRGTKEGDSSHLHNVTGPLGVYQ